MENSKYFLALIWLSSFNLRKYVEATAVYLSASLLAKFIPFLLLPVFTRLLSESDYGVLGIFGTLVAIGSVFIGLRPDIYIIRVYNELDQRVYSELKLAFMVMIPLTAAAYFVGLLLINDMFPEEVGNVVLLLPFIPQRH